MSSNNSSSSASITSISGDEFYQLIFAPDRRDNTEKSSSIHFDLKEITYESLIDYKEKINRVNEAEGYAKEAGLTLGLLVKFLAEKVLMSEKVVGSYGQRDVKGAGSLVSLVLVEREGDELKRGRSFADEFRTTICAAGAIAKCKVAGHHAGVGLTKHYQLLNAAFTDRNNSIVDKYWIIRSNCSNYNEEITKENIGDACKKLVKMASEGEITDDYELALRVERRNAYKSTDGKTSTRFKQLLNSEDGWTTANLLSCIIFDEEVEEDEAPTVVEVEQELTNNEMVEQLRRLRDEHFDELDEFEWLKDEELFEEVMKRIICQCREIGGEDRVSFIDEVKREKERSSVEYANAVAEALDCYYFYDKKTGKPLEGWWNTVWNISYMLDDLVKFIDRFSRENNSSE